MERAKYTRLIGRRRFWLIGQFNKHIVSLVTSFLCHLGQCTRSGLEWKVECDLGMQNKQEPSAVELSRLHTTDESERLNKYHRKCSQIVTITHYH